MNESDTKSINGGNGIGKLTVEYLERQTTNNGRRIDPVIYPLYIQDLSDNFIDDVEEYVHKYDFQLPIYTNDESMYNQLMHTMQHCFGLQSGILIPYVRTLQQPTQGQTTTTYDDNDNNFYNFIEVDDVYQLKITLETKRDRGLVNLQGNVPTLRLANSGYTSGSYLNIPTACTKNNDVNTSLGLGTDATLDIFVNESGAITGIRTNFEGFYGYTTGDILIATIGGKTVEIQLTSDDINFDFQPYYGFRQSNQPIIPEDITNIGAAEDNPDIIITPWHVNNTRLIEMVLEFLETNDLIYNSVTDTTNPLGYIMNGKMDGSTIGELTIKSPVGSYVTFPMDKYLQSGVTSTTKQDFNNSVKEILENNLSNFNITEIKYNANVIVLNNRIYENNDNILGINASGEKTRTIKEYINRISIDQEETFDDKDEIFDIKFENKNNFHYFTINHHGKLRTVKNQLLNSITNNPTDCDLTGKNTENGDLGKYINVETTTDQGGSGATLDFEMLNIL